MKGNLHTRIASLAAILLCVSLCFMTAYAVADYTVLTKLHFTDNRVLFDTMHALMPGDSYADSIRLTNSTTDRVVRFYVAAKPADYEEYADLGMEQHYNDALQLLRELTLTVSTADGHTIYKGPADGSLPAQGDALNSSSYVWIATLPAGGQAEFKVQVDVPILLGNEYMNTQALFNWYFYTTEDTGGGGGTGTGTGTGTGGGGGGGGSNIRDGDVVIIDDGGTPLGGVEIIESDVPLLDLPRTGLGQADMLRVILLAVAIVAFIMAVCANRKQKTK